MDCACISTFSLHKLSTEEAANGPMYEDMLNINFRLMKLAVLRDKGGMIQQNCVLTIGRGGRH